MNIIRVDAVGSTNSYLKELSGRQQLEEGTVVVTGNQTSGRGQVGNHWESEPGKNLTFSILLRPHALGTTENFLILQMVALSVKEVLDKQIQDVKIKWPNDIYVNNRKIAGILIENEFMGDLFSQSIIGIGLNVNQEVFLSDAPNPVSLIQLINVETDLDSLLQEIVKQLLSNYQLALSGGAEEIRTRYKSALYRKTGLHSFSDKNGTFLAEIDSVKNSGVLVLKTSEGEIREYVFKEVAFIE